MLTPKVSSEIKEILIASKKYGDDINAITEVWQDSTGIFCIRISDLVYDIVNITDAKGVTIMTSGLFNKPSAISTILGRVVEGDKGQNPVYLTWKKIPDVEKKLLGDDWLNGDHATEDGKYRFSWSKENMVLRLSAKLKTGDVELVLTDGPITEAEAKVFEAAIRAYSIRSLRKVNPLEKKPRAKKDGSPASTAPDQTVIQTQKQ